MKKLVVLVIILTAFNCYSQEDSFAKQSLDFVKSVVVSNQETDIQQFVSKDLNIDSLSTLSARFVEHQKDINYHIIKVDREVRLYNINIFNSKTDERLGDFRILFSDDNDLLIDDWKYIEYKELEDEMGLPSLPPPTPPKN